MSETRLPDASILLESLRSEVCPHCGGKKKQNQSVCYAGWRALSQKQNKALYMRFGNGYEEALAVALETLNPGGDRFWPEPKGGAA